MKFPKPNLPKIKIESQVLNNLLKKLNLSRKTVATALVVIVALVVIILGRKSPFSNRTELEDILPSESLSLALDGSTQPDTPVEQDTNKYTAFYFEVYDLIKSTHWNKLTDQQLNAITKLAVENITEENLISVPNTKQDMRSVLIKTMENMTEEEKKEFIVQLADVVLANLEPFGRSRLYTSQKREDLANTVNNIDPTTNHYDVLEIEKGASIQQVETAYNTKITNLQNQEQTPEVEQQIKKVEKAHNVLSDPDSKELYDEMGIEPTISYDLITPRIFYFHITKFSPTTVEELQRVTQKVDSGSELDTLIVDLRGNIGGAIDGLPYFLGPFIGQNQYAYQFFSRGEKQDFITKTGWLPSLVRYKKVIILTDEQVQSSAEVFAATLKKYNVGVVVGTTTKGWGTVEAVFKLNNQIDPENETYSVLLVHSLTLREDGVPIEGNGVIPTVSTNSPNWQGELYKYFENQQLIDTVGNVLSQPPITN